MPGLYEAPAKPEQYYEKQQKHAMLSGDTPPREVLENEIEGEFLVVDDPRTTEALKGYVCRRTTTSTPKRTSVRSLTVSSRTRTASGASSQRSYTGQRSVLRTLSGIVRPKPESSGHHFATASDCPYSTRPLASRR